MLNKIEKLKSLKLLFVEDEVDLLHIITDTLDKLGANYLLAKNGEEGLDVLKNNSDIDIIVTDINMPIMTGIEMLKEINKIQNYDHIDTVVMSAHTESDFIEKAKDLGVQNYLFKPFDFIKFIDLISSLHDKKNA
ncbi:MAG: response regulator [Campylobacterota bacterium]|nr:response regulator [Campylobacterota bacterium]